MNLTKNKKMSKEELDLIEFALIVWITFFITVIGYRQIDHMANKDE
jgi:hypothetical protein